MTGRYLIDVVSAASIRGETPQSEGDDDDRSRQVVDVVTSASGRGGEEPEGPDDLRHEFGFGVTQLMAGSTITVNGI